MSHFYYQKPYGREPLLAVKCDGCGDAFFTERTGQEFPYHVYDARDRGWKHRKENGKWVDYCPECDSFIRQELRTKHFAQGG